MCASKEGKGRCCQHFVSLFFNVHTVHTLFLHFLTLLLLLKKMQHMETQYYHLLLKYDIIQLTLVQDVGGIEIILNLDLRQALPLINTIYTYRVYEVLILHGYDCQSA